MATLLKRKRWRFIGHILRKPAYDLARVALRWTPEGKGKQERPKTTWKRTVEAEMKKRDYRCGESEKKAPKTDYLSLLYVPSGILRTG